MTETQVQVTVKTPGPDEPGFLRRQRDLMAALAGVDTARSSRDINQVLAAMDGLADEMAQYLEPSNGMEPRELAYELSREQFFEVLGALAGKAEPPPKKSST